MKALHVILKTLHVNLTTPLEHKSEAIAELSGVPAGKPSEDWDAPKRASQTEFQSLQQKRNGSRDKND